MAYRDHPNSTSSLPFSLCATLDRGSYQIPKETQDLGPPLCPQLLGVHSQSRRGSSSVLHGVSPMLTVLPCDARAIPHTHGAPLCCTGCPPLPLCSPVLHRVSSTPTVLSFSSPLSCSMKHTFPLVLKAKVSGVMHRVWKMAAWATLRMDRLHSRHTAQASCSLRPRSRRERMSARDTFSCQDRIGVSLQRAAPGRTKYSIRRTMHQRHRHFTHSQEKGLKPGPYLGRVIPLFLECHNHGAFGEATSVLLGTGTDILERQFG